MLYYDIEAKPEIPEKARKPGNDSSILNQQSNKQSQ